LLQAFDKAENGVAPDFNIVPFKDQLKDEEIWNVVKLRSLHRQERSRNKKGGILIPPFSPFPPEPTYLDRGSGRTWNFTSLGVSPLPPSMWNGARVDTGV
jgi:hypothetical protein